MVILEWHNNQEDLDDAEDFWIACFHTLAPNGYNLTTGGKGGKCSEETRLKMSESAKKACREKIGKLKHPSTTLCQSCYEVFISTMCERRWKRKESKGYCRPCVYKHKLNTRKTE